MPPQPSPSPQPENQPKHNRNINRTVLIVLLVAAIPVLLVVLLLAGIFVAGGAVSVSRSSSVGPAELDGGISPVVADETFVVTRDSTSRAAFLESEGSPSITNSATVTDFQALSQLVVGSETLRTFVVDTVAADGTEQSCAGMSGLDGSGLVCGPNNPFDSEVDATGPPTDPAILDITHSNEEIVTLGVVLPPGEAVSVMQVTAENGWVGQANFVGDASGYQSAIVSWDSSFGSSDVISFFAADGREVWTNR